jgi:hypothetical protein
MVSNLQLHQPIVDRVTDCCRSYWGEWMQLWRLKRFIRLNPESLSLSLYCLSLTTIFSPEMTPLLNTSIPSMTVERSPSITRNGCVRNFP